ncbi:MAG: histidine kinase [bacterium]
MFETNQASVRAGQHDRSRVSALGAAAPARAWNTRREWVVLWLYAFVAYTGFVILTVTSNALNNIRLGVDASWADMITRHALQEYSCALFVPPLFWLVHRYPIDRLHWRKSIPILFVASFAFVVVKYGAVYLPLMRVVFPNDIVSLTRELGLNSVEVLSDFLGVIGVAHAIEFHRRAQDRERLTTQLRAQLSEAQLQVLRSQLHPHFLFNTLNGVATLMHRDVNAADRMVTDLATLLRATLQDAGPHEIPLTDELDLLERYIAIVSMRFGDRLTVEQHISADVRDALVPQFLLQPLVENAIEYGVARRPGPGTLIIRAIRVEEQICVTVSDDGPGLRGDSPAGHGIGLANTRARLRELYGDEQQLHLAPASADGGVCVTVTLPYHRRSALPVSRAKEIA